MNEHDGLPVCSRTLLSLAGAFLLFGAIAGWSQSRASSSRVVAKHSGKCMEVSGKGFEDGAPVWQSPCTGADSQSFRFRHVSRGGNTFYEILVEQSGKCLEAAGGSSGNELSQFACSGRDSQLFQLNRDPDGDYEIMGKDSNRCVGVELSSRSDRSRVALVPCGEGDAQRWKVSLDPGGK